MALILSLIIVVLFIIFPIYLTNRKIKALRKSKVVAISSRKNNPNRFLLGNYYIPVQIINPGKIEVISPELNNMGDVVYNSFWVFLSEIFIPKFKERNNPIELDAARELSIYIREHLKIEKEVNLLQEQYHQVNDLARLISKSEVYFNQIDIYDKAIIEIEKLINKAKQLENLYIKVIREGLIGVKVANYNPNNIQNNQIAHQLQYKKLRQEYKYMKDTATAYGELMRQYHK